MARSLRVAQEYIDHVRAALTRNGFVSQAAFMENSQLDYSRDTFSKFFNGKPIERIYFEEICLKLGLDWKEITHSSLVKTREDWGTAPEVRDQDFVGRKNELEQLGSWILGDRCRLVTILGMGGIGKTNISVKLGKGGIGKTDLAIKLARNIQDGFDCIIWKSLENAPLLDDILHDLIKFISKQQDITNARTNYQESEKLTIFKQIDLLIDYLKKYRCLLILDNAESLLEKNGRYRPEHECYAQLLDKIAEVQHQSCVLITSREKLRHLERFTGQDRLVRFFHLSGLNYEDGRKIFSAKGNFLGNEQQWCALIDFYNGNPFALELAADHVLSLFGGDIEKFWQYGKPIFEDIDDLLSWHFQRLLEHEQELVIWLAICREPVSIAEIRECIFVNINRHKIANTLRSLQRKFPIEEAGNQRFSLHPLLIEYITDYLIQQVCQELNTEDIEKINISNSYSLLQAQAQDYVREYQIRMIIEPIVDYLLTKFKTKQNLSKHLLSMLSCLQQDYSQYRGYLSGNIINLLCYLQIDLTGIDFSNLCIWQADLRKVFLHNTNFINSDLTHTAFRKSFAGVLDLAFSPNGQYLAVGDFNGEIHILRVQTWEEIYTFQKHPWHVAYVAFSPDSQFLVSSCLNGFVKLWDLTTGRLKWEHKAHDQWCWSVNFHPSGEFLASGSDDGTIKFWHTETGKYLKEISAHNAPVLSVAFSPDGKTLISGGFDHQIKIWSVITNECLKVIAGSESGVWTVAFSPDGKTIASCGTESVIRLWDSVSGDLLRILTGHTKEIKMLCFSPDGKKIASGAFAPDSSVRIWDVDTGNCTMTGVGHRASVRTITYHPYYPIVATGDLDQNLKVWNVNTGKCVKDLQGNNHAIWAVAYNHDGKTIAASYLDHKIRLWNLNGNKKSHQIFTGHLGWIWAVVFSPDRKTLASCSDDETIKIWDLQTGNILQELKSKTIGYHGGVWAIAYSLDGQTLVSGGQDNIVRVWELKTGKSRNLLGHQHWIVSLAFCPDGNSFASASNDGTIRIWDIKTYKCVQVYKGHTNKVRAVSYSSDGKRLASGSEDCTVKIWDSKTGKCVKTLEGHQANIFAVAYGDRLIASGSDDNTVKLWDANSGNCLHTLLGHTSIVRSVMFSPDGRTIASGGLDSLIKIWDVATGKCLDTLTMSRPYEGMNISGTTGIIAGQKAALRNLGAFSDASR